MTLRFEHLDPDAVQRHAERLRTIEHAITYPLDDDRFFIDHGARYPAFFESLGDAHFLVAFDDDALVGLCAVAFRDATLPDGRRYTQLYGGDLKLAPGARGRGVARRLFGEGLRRVFFDARIPRWDLAFGAAMTGARGDVRRTFGGLHVGRLASPLAVLDLYFEPPARLLALPDGGPLAPPGGLDLGRPGPRPLVQRNTGTKEFRLVSSGAPWPLVHLPWGPDAWSPSLGAKLRAAAASLAPGELACFGLDRRLAPTIAWLADHGVRAGATCTILAFAHPWHGPRGLRHAPWVHFPTREI